MGSLNKVMLIGNLGDDPKLRELEGGGKVCNFTVATNERFKDRSGEMQEKVEWHRCVAWNKTADVIDGYLRKGSPVFIEGKLQTRKYDKDGQTHYATEVYVLNVQFLAKKPDGGESTHRERPAETRTDYGSPLGADDDIPF